MFATPKRHILAQNREFWRILHQNPSRGLGCSELQEPSPPIKHLLVCNLARKVTHARKRNPWADRDELLHRCRGPRRYHLCHFLWLSHTGFLRVGGQILGFYVDLHRRPYNTLAQCECVIKGLRAALRPINCDLPCRIRAHCILTVAERPRDAVCHWKFC